jgi:alpha-tubulin suppressor-like RCC1 family protein
VMDKLNLGMIKTVPSYVSLINLPLKETLGELYFVENEDKVYYRALSDSVYVWVSLFGNEKDIDRAWAWGSNSFGQLGDNTTIARSSPISVVGGYTDWTQVIAGDTHSLAIRENGTAWAWGQGADGRLGDNTGVAQSSPVSVVGGFTDWVQVSGGNRHSLGLRADGTAWAWGVGLSGGLGDGTTTTRSSPVSVAGGFTDWIQVSAGNLHGLGVRANGTAWGWGCNSAGKIGDGTVGAKSSPVSVIGGFTDWTQVSAGDTHSLGLRSNGTAWGWGNNIDGRVGDNAGGSRNSPVSVVGGFTDWTQLSAGGSHSLGLRSNGTAWAWGNGNNGRLGDNSSANQSSPVSVVGGYTDWIQLSSGFNHTLGVRANGTAWAWGSGNIGRLGDGTTVDKSSPVSFLGSFTDWTQVSGGGNHSLGLRV